MQTYKTCQGDSPNCSNSLGATSLNSADHSMDVYITLKVGSSWWQALNDIFSSLGNAEIKAEKQNLWRQQE
jgi:hypothetical protein